MSWFNAGALANIAKSALKEAQKTIDKALDIKEDAENIVPTNTPIDTNPDDFFGTWGISQSGNITTDTQKDHYNEASEQNKLATSIWGSFTGSFFVDNQNTKDIQSPSIESLNESIDSNNERDFSKSKLVVQHSEEEHSMEEDNTKLDEEKVLGVLYPLSDKQLEQENSINRLSYISTESGKNNSESLDVLTGSTECTTSPDSDVTSTGLSVSSSAQGSKQISESVEVLGDSLASPSSVEIISSDTTTSEKCSEETDEFVSPVDSPCIDVKISPESVEIIPEDQDETSIAEDTMSYTSISESTSATVLDTAFNIHSKPQKMLKDTYNRPDFNETIGSDTGTLSPERSFSTTEAITRAPSRSMHLPLTQVNHNQMLIDTQPHSVNKQDIPKILEKTNVIDIPQDEENLRSSGSENQLDTSTDDGSQSDRTLIETQENLMDSSSETTSTTTEASSNSTYLKKMIADAMVEKSPESAKNTPEAGPDFSDKASSLDSVATSSQIEVVHRENSPMSSEKSDLVKIESDHTSCHTSCDELETTTSSDIEIISSPNGDSSSTQSRQSPAKKNLLKAKSAESAVDLIHKMAIKKVKGHNRELSEASSISDDSHNNVDIDKLLKRVSEMTEILESRESKLIDMNRRNVELQEQNSDLKTQLDCVLTQQLQSADVTQVTEEYTQRLSALEKKFQQAIREKDTLRKQLDQAKLDVAARMSKNEMESAISEKEDLIKELRQEGEKLSKQQLQHCNIIKKLRAKEKEHEATIKHLKETNENLSLETDRLKKSLSAKEDVERTQIEAVHNLTTKNKKLESEMMKLKSQLDDLTQKYDTTKKSLDAAKKELSEKNKTASELLAKQQHLESLENEKKMTESQNEEVINQLDDLRYQLQKTEEEYMKKEQNLKKENGELLRKLEEAESRNEELSQSISEVSKPLIRQLESLQATHQTKASNFDKVEQALTLKIRDLQTKLESATSLERSTKQECVSLRSKLADLKGQLNTTKQEMELSKMELANTKSENEMLQEELRSENKKLAKVVKKKEEIIEEKEREIENLKTRLVVEKTPSETDKKASSVNLQDSGPKEYFDKLFDSAQSGSNSPTLSLGKVSVPDSLSSQHWSPGPIQDELFEASHAPHYTNMFELQILQSNLKQREGELKQLQWELNRREHERSLMNDEICSLHFKIGELDKLKEDHKQIYEEMSGLKKKHDTLLQLFGEKVEENEELKLDLEDVKAMYKSQIDELLRQQKKN